MIKNKVKNQETFKLLVKFEETAKLKFVYNFECTKATFPLIVSSTKLETMK